MADPITNELLFDVLKSVQNGISLLREDVDTIKSRLTSIDTRLGLVHTDIAHQSERLDRLELRLGRVEKRLTITD